MGKTILEIAVSVDGYVAGLHDEQDWLDDFADLSELGFDTFIASVGVIMVGMRSYQLGVERGWFKGQVYGSSPIIVVCKEMPENPSTDADFRFVTSGIQDAHGRALKIAGEKNIYVFGGPSIAQQLIDLDLLDELRLSIVPVLLGQGIPLFAHLRERRIRLERIDVRAFSRGLTSLIYRVVK
ncbi:MAG TPA: dihydrofolate reductase family protein [Candidatus Saccharimonadales bacterium]|nr:dihydrofolate reductase family protein [Candidatus Saccharimonadales bacterium]